MPLPIETGPTFSASSDAVQRLIARYAAAPHALVQILREAQALHGWLPRELLAEIADALGLTLAHVQGVAGFYRFFHTRPVGAYRVLFSNNITDRMLGNEALMRDLCQRLGVTRGQVRADGRVSVTTASCTGLCDQGPALLVNHQHVVTRLNPGRIEHIAALIEAQVPPSQWPPEWSRVDDQIRLTDVKLGTQPAPGEALAEAVARGRQGMLDDLKRSKLRGRGGAGYATATKWQLCRDSPGEARYVVCNADEGEPGTFKDRVLLTSYANGVIEGMTIAAWVVGSRHGLIYLRGEYRYLLQHLESVLQRRREQNLLGTAIQGHAGFDFDIEIHIGAGAYVCTFSAVTHIAMHGGEWWSRIGTPQSTGTKIHSVSGDCERPGIYEYPFGTRIGRILEDCGARDTQAVQVGGPSGVCLSAFEFNRRIGFEDVPTAGAFMVFDRSRDMFTVARNFAHFFAHESCGFCTPCRVGTQLVVKRMEKLQRGDGSAEDVQVLFELDKLMHGTTHCGLGAAACNPLRDTISKFRPAYERHLKSLHFVPGFDLDAELSQARLATARDDSGAHLENKEDPGSLN